MTRTRSTETEPETERGAGTRTARARRIAAVVAVGAVVALGAAACGSDSTSSTSSTSAGGGTTSSTAGGTTSLTAPAGAETVADADYASTACTTLGGLQTAEAALAAELDALDVADPEAFQTAAGELVDTYITDLERARTEMADVAPTNGADVSAGMDAYLTAAISRLGSIRADLQQADPTSATFIADIATFEADLAFLARELPDPFAGVESDELLAAFQAEAACADLVAVAEPA